MNAIVDIRAALAVLAKPDATTPAIIATGALSLAIVGGVTFRGDRFTADTPVALPAAGLRPGADYVVAVNEDGVPLIREAATADDCQRDDVLGGFHFAPGGNAQARAGGDTMPAINPYSIWDIAFRPAAPDPRGMTRIAIGEDRAFWSDIYLLAADHVAGTSRHGVTIADGDDPPAGRKRLDYETAVAVLAEHGKQVPSVEEFFALAYGVTEKSACGDDPETTGLDAPRISKWGVMQATGNLWVWGHDGDPDSPRASIFGGSWLDDVHAGSRYAGVACRWPDNSLDYIGARGRCDHLQPV